jgi:hypothetical protein
MPLTNDNTQAQPQLPMTDAQLEAWEASREIDAELLESVRQYKRGEGRVVYPGVVRELSRAVSDDSEGAASQDAQKETPAPVTVAKGGRGSSGA